MASESSASLPPRPQSRQPTYAWKIQNFSNTRNHATSNAIETTWQSNSNSAASRTASKAPAGDVKQLVLPSRLKTVKVEPEKTRKPKRRKLDAQDEAVRASTAAAISSSLAADHILALYPDADTPFEDEEDAVARLLPYHVFQYPKIDLEAVRDPKGKAKATAADQLRDEIEETRFALECHIRYRALQNRLRKVRTRHGKYSSPHGQSIVLSRLGLESDRVATQELDHELQAARSELDKITRARRQATSSAARQVAAASAAAALPQFFSYAGVPLATQQYYNRHTYAYCQQAAPYGTGSGSSFSAAPTRASAFTPAQGANPYAQPSTAASSSVFAVHQQPAAASSAAAAPSASTSQAAAAATHKAPPPVAIPLQIPINALPTLHALGITPVPKAALPPPNEPQPAAVLLGATAGGTVLSLEINAGLLGAPQMSGLAILLSSLMRVAGGAAANANAGGRGATPAQESNGASSTPDASV